MHRITRFLYHATQFLSSGVMDAVLVSTIWPIANDITKTNLGFTQYITVPVGEYDTAQGTGTESRRKPMGL